MEAKGASRPPSPVEARGSLSATFSLPRAPRAKIVEAYPVEPTGKLTGYSGYTGIASTFRRAGFVEVRRASEHQRIMRYWIQT